MMAAKSRLPKLLFAVSVASIIVASVTVALAQSVAPASAGEMIAFIRNGDIWIMSPDGSNQRPLVAGIGNAKGTISWEPGNNRLVFARKGDLTIKYPDGGGGQHQIYDLFFAYLDSTNNFWMGFTETFGALYPDWSADGSRIAFTYDENAVISNSTWPNYQIGFYDIRTRAISSLELPRGDNLLMARTAALSPDGSRIAFLMAEFDGKRVIPLGLVVTSTSSITQTAEQLLSTAKKISAGTAPSWSPDGKWLAFVSTDMSNQGIYIVKPDLTGMKLIYQATAGLTLPGSPPSWSPDSKKLAFCTGNGAIYTVNLDGTNATLISGPGSDQAPAWSK
jgi:Tol biopolymer transport system component